MSDDGDGRCRRLADALIVLEFLVNVRHTFKAQELADELGYELRSAYRWMQVAEGFGYVKKAEKHGYWESLVRFQVLT